MKGQVAVSVSFFRSVLSSLVSVLCRVGASALLLSLIVSRRKYVASMVNMFGDCTIHGFGGLDKVG